MNIDHDHPSLAKVRAGQTLLFPQSARKFCETIGLNWWAAIKLYADGWLSFDPENTPALNEAQEQELSFVGSLVTSGCSPLMMAELLSGLERPFCYNGRQIYYDWAEHRWRLLPKPYAEPESVFAEWLDALKADGELARLEEIKAEVESALASLKPTSSSTETEI